MNSKKLEEVRKRRAKASSSGLNLYQKTVLVAGGLTLLFLAIGLSRKWALFLAAGVTGATHLIFWIFRNFEAKKKEASKAVSQETLPEAEEAVTPEPISSRTGEEIIADSPGVISKPTDSDAAQGSISPEPEKAVTISETPPVEKGDLSPAEEFSGDGALAQIQERLASVEEKITKMEGMVLSLETKLADMQETQLKSGPQIDLQTILTNLDERHEKVAQ